MNNSALGRTWQQARGELFTPEEISASDSRLADDYQTTFTNEQLLKTVKWFIKFLEDTIDENGDYCRAACPLRDNFGCCDAICRDEIYTEDDYEEFEERDFPLCMNLQIKYFVEKANE